MLTDTNTALLIINRELTRRLTTYATYVREGDMTKDEANHRYLALQTAACMLGAKGRPAIWKLTDEVLDELRRWAKELQRNATYETVHTTARDMAEIAVAIEFITALAARKGGGA